MKIFLLLIFCIYSLYSSILQDAIDDAPPYAVLKLPDGIYKGSVVIDKPLTIMAKDKNAIIDGDGVGNIITIKSSNVILKNLTIQNSGDQIYSLDSAIFIDKAKKIQIQNCKILDSLYGINMLMVEDSVISDNYITSKNHDISLRGDALKIWHSNNIIIKNNTINRSRDATLNYSNNNEIFDNTFTNSRFALHISHSKNNNIKNNIYKYNSVGIILSGAKNTKVLNNSIKSSTGAAGMGVVLQGVFDFEFKNNILMFNAKGIYIDSKATEVGIHRKIINNKISFNKEAMRFHLTIRNNMVVNNEFIGNIDDIVKGTAGYKTADNIIKNNYWDRYTGFDKDGDNIGDTSHKIYQYADQLWHYNHKVKFFYGSVVMSLLNFLSQLAPFIEPVLLLEDSSPTVKLYNQPL